MDDCMKRLEHCLSQLRKITDFVPEVALTLGSGLGDFASAIHPVAEVEYSDLADFPVSTVPLHRGRFLFGELEGIRVAVMQGRVHYYEGYSMDEVVLPIRLLGRMGAKAAILTNASGGISPELHVGDLMLIRDHISTFVPNPLVGPNPDGLGTRFPDMSHAYDPELCDCLRQAAKAENIPLREGIYVQLTGPSYESPAEIRMLGRLGADAVGMSTVVETIAARHMGLRVCGISCVSNLAAGISKIPLSHAEVVAAGERVGSVFSALLRRAVPMIAEKL